MNPAEGAMVPNLDQLQAKIVDWDVHQPWRDSPAWHNLLGLVEEVGELSHAYLKREQGIRTDEDHTAKIADAVGDIVIYLCGFCTRENISIDECIRTAWAEVVQRSWNENPEKGV